MDNYWSIYPILFAWLHWNYHVGAARQSQFHNRFNATLRYNVKIVAQIVKAIRVKRNLIYCFQCLLTFFTIRLFLGDEITFSSPTF